MKITGRQAKGKDRPTHKHTRSSTTTTRSTTQFKDKEAAVAHQVLTPKECNAFFLRVGIDTNNYRLKNKDAMWVNKEEAKRLEESVRRQQNLVDQLTSSNSKSGSTN